MTTGTKPEIRQNAHTKGDQIMSAVNTLKAKVMNAYSESVREGNMSTAHGLLTLLRLGKISLGLSDAAYKIECMLEAIGCKITYSRYNCIATAYLTPEV